MLVSAIKHVGTGLSLQVHLTCQTQTEVGETLIAAFVNCLPSSDTETGSDASPQQHRELRQKAEKGGVREAAAKKAGVQVTQNQKTWAPHLSCIYTFSCSTYM